MAENGNVRNQDKDVDTTYPLETFGEMAENGKTREEEEEGADTTDAKGVMSKFLSGFSKSAMSKVTIEDIQDVETGKLKNYKKMPGVMTRKEMLADVYKMDFPRRGKALIINNKHFAPELARRGFHTRLGTDIDAKKISSRLKLLGFDVERRQDITCDDMKYFFQKAANEDHSNADCFVGVLLSHGENEMIYGVDGCFELREIFSYFQGDRCKSLIGKPKVFFVQACRGKQLDAGTNLNVTDARRDYDYGSPYINIHEDTIKIPNEADFLVSFSTVPGYYSWRNLKHGSWFMQALVELLDECGTDCDVITLLTKVNRRVAYDPRFQSYTYPDDPKVHGMKQVPSFTSMLTKDLYFAPKTK